MRVSDYVVAALYEQGVRQVFELSGGMITYLLDALDRDRRIQLVNVHHEQAAAFAADAVGRMTGIPGVALATSGPGATNLLTGIGSCYFDSSPAVFITGQVNRDEQKGDRPIRQLGFQETDIVAIAAPVTKAAWKVATPEEVPAVLSRAFRLATEGRPGPVLIDLPVDVQRSELERTWVEPEPPGGGALPVVNCEPMRAALLAARRPLVLAGGGIRAGRAHTAFLRLLERLPIPVVHSLMGVDALPFQHPLRVGMIGTYGNRWANLALCRSDVLVVLGSRLDVRQTGARTDAFSSGRRIFHVDCEAGEINNRVSGCEGVVTELACFLPQLEQSVDGLLPPQEWADWRAEIGRLRGRWPDTAELSRVDGINPNELMHQLSRHSRQAAAYVVDVGQHQMWAAQSLELEPGQRFLTSGGMGSMGFAAPAAIGAALSAPGQPVVVIAGDGGFQCNIQELQTVVRLGLPLKIVVLNNRCHGMVRQFQDDYFEGRYAGTWCDYSTPDFAAVAAAFGIPSQTLLRPEETAGRLAWLWEEPRSARLLEVEISPLANAYPKVAFGQPLSQMEPFPPPDQQ